MLKKTIRAVLLWCGAYLLAAACFLWVFPILLFIFYPFSMPFLLLYLLVTAVASIVYFVTKKRPARIIRKCHLALPALAMILTMIAIATGWIRFPG